MTLWRDIKELLREFWFAPMMWPIMVAYEISSWMGWNEVHWSIAVLVIALMTTLVFVLTPVMIPVNLVVFAGILLWAPFALIIHLTKKEPQR